MDHNRTFLVLASLITMTLSVLWRHRCCGRPHTQRMDSMRSMKWIA